MNRLSSPTFFALFLVLLGCGKAAPPVPRGVQGSSQGTARAAPPEPEEAAPEEDAPPMRALPSPFQAGPGDLTVPTQPAAPQPAAAAPASPTRDLGAEVANLARAPGCLDLRAAASQPGGKLLVSVDAYVMASGRITRATVRAPGQPPAALRCAENRVVQAGLSGPVPGAPTSVSGQISIEVAIAGAPATPAAQPAAPVAPPDPYALPAQAPPPPAERAATSSNDRLGGGLIPDEQAGAP